MPRYLLVLDMDLLAVDTQLDLEPVRYLMARQEEQPCEVTVLSVAGTRQARLSGWERVLGGAAANISPLPVKLPVAPRPGHDVSTAAEHRTHAAVRQLETIGCRARGLRSWGPRKLAELADWRRHVVTLPYSGLVAVRWGELRARAEQRVAPVP